MLEQIFKNKLSELSQYFRHDDFYYKNIYDFVLMEGKMYKSEHLTKEENKYTMKRIKSVNGKFEQHQCFYNSGRLSIGDLSEKIKYVEGFIFKKDLNVPILHAWNEINGKVIDLTVINKYGEFTLGSYEDDIAYCGTVFPTAYIRKIFLSKSSRSILSDIANPNKLWPILHNQFTEENIKSLL